MWAVASFSTLLTRKEAETELAIGYRDASSAFAQRIGPPHPCSSPRR